MHFKVDYYGLFVITLQFKVRQAVFFDTHINPFNITHNNRLVHPYLSLLAGRLNPFNLNTVRLNGNLLVSSSVPAGRVGLPTLVVSMLEVAEAGDAPERPPVLCWFLQPELRDEIPEGHVGCNECADC